MVASRPWICALGLDGEPTQFNAVNARGPWIVCLVSENETGTHFRDVKCKVCR